MSQWRSKIITDYAGWTVLSALRSGAPIKSRGCVYPLLRTVNFDVLLRRSEIPVASVEFDDWHESETINLCRRQSRLCVGWAAKMLNVYLKTAVYVGGLGRPGLPAALHPPIDSGLWHGLSRRFSGRSDVLGKTHVVTQIKAIRDYNTYRAIIAGCRLAAAELGCILIEVEQLWDGADRIEDGP